ncbi:MAG: Sulfatase [Prosthecobacter sp.]|nr:Sulfatase [Prosthecobacter sp.]
MKAFVALLLCTFTFHVLAAETKRPNILFIYADDQSTKTVGCYPGSWPWVKTPNIDALAANGVRFHAAYLGSWCMPSRATMLTGRFPHGIESMSMEGKYPGSTYDPKQCPFIPAEMRKQGYHTAQIGKWHTGTDTGWGRDWDHQIVWNRPLHPENAGAYYETQIMSVDGKEQTMDGYPADNYTQWSLDYIRGKNRDAAKPWYLWVCYGSVHGPSIPAERHKGSYKDAAVPIPADIFPPREGKPEYLNKMQAWIKGEDGHPMAKKGGEAFGESKKGTRFDAWVRQVNECVPAIDEGVGRLIAALKESGQYENTLIIYTADQGFSMGEHGFRAKLAPYDANYGSPLIISMPSRFPTGKVCNASVNAPDLAATFLSISGVKVPWQTHGRDLLPLLEKSDSAWSHPCYYEHMGNEYGAKVSQTILTGAKQANHQGVPLYSALVQDQFKLIHYLDGKSGEELYDLKNDPEELKNLINETSHTARITQLRAAMKAELKRTESAFTDFIK